jgi:ATP-dependent protease Clp ATPase subunit
MSANEARCSFCNKPAGAVQALIQAPKKYGEVYICTECVRASAAILDSAGGEMLLKITKETVQ